MCKPKEEAILPRMLSADSESASTKLGLQTQKSRSSISSMLLAMERSIMIAMIATQMAHQKDLYSRL